jgi:hypothetical protein
VQRSGPARCIASENDEQLSGKKVAQGDYRNGNQFFQISRRSRCVAGATIRVQNVELCKPAIDPITRALCNFTHCLWVCGGR